MIKVHILGASGSGATTLAAALARRLGAPHLDTDHYFWVPTDPPFRQPREREERQALLAAALPAAGGWVLSGSLCGWGDVFISTFELVVFLWIPSGVRLARLRERERRRYGNAIAPGGPLHEAHDAFMSWAAAYDDGGLEMRSRRLHETWLAELPCPVLRFTDVQPTEVQLEHVLGWLGSRAPRDDRPR